MIRRFFRFLFSLLKLAFLLAMAVVGFAIWRQYSEQSSPAFQPSPPAPPPAGAYAAPDLPVVDLVVVGARGRWENGQKYFEVTVQNRGPGVASVVHGDCSYRCSSSGISIDSAALFRNAYLAPGQPFNQLLPVTPCNDTSYQLSCIVYAGNVVQELDRNNNHWVGGVQIQ